MFQLHGWIEVLTAVTDDESMEHQLEIVGWLRQQIADLGLRRGAEVSACGGSFVVRLMFVQNRERGDLGRCLQLLGALGALAVGSYGVLYVRDDDHVDGNNFRQFVMRRGQIEIVAEQYLSPIVPTLEGEQPRRF